MGDIRFNPFTFTLDVRDFAFATSRKFIWDAMGAERHSVNGRRVLAMSYYPKEGMPLWDKYSTHAIAHTLDVYSRRVVFEPLGMRDDRHVAGDEQIEQGFVEADGNVVVWRFDQHVTGIAQR